MSPWSPFAIGARVPSKFAVPTDTRHFTGRITLNSDSSGNLSYVWIGHPLWTGFAPYSTVPVPAPAVNPLTTYTANPSVGAAMTLASLGAAFSSYRMVGNGLQIHNMQAPLNATGRIIVARVPMGKRFFGPNALQNNASTPAYLFNRLTGMTLDAGNHIPVNILNLPVVSELSVSQLLTSQINCANRCIGDTAFEFRNASAYDTAYSGTLVTGDEVLVTATGSVQLNGIDAEDDILSDGWTCILIRGEGLPASTACLDLRVCSHIEGVPAVYGSGPSGAASFVSAAAPTTSSAGSLDRILDSIRSVPFGQIVATAQTTARVAYTGYSMYRAITNPAAAVRTLARRQY